MAPVATDIGYGSFGDVVMAIGSWNSSRFSTTQVD
jgi:hypothetical protein